MVHVCVCVCVLLLGMPFSFAKWTPNAKYLAVGSLDDSLSIWDFESGKPCKSFKGHTNRKYPLFIDFLSLKQNAKSQSRNRSHALLLCGSESGSFLTWDLVTVSCSL